MATRDPVQDLGSGVIERSSSLVLHKCLPRVDAKFGLPAGPDKHNTSFGVRMSRCSFILHFGSGLHGINSLMTTMAAVEPILSKTSDR